jgi:LmbE family N-acetylglucosaminyl deacetylase
MMNPFQKFVSESAKVFKNGKKLPSGLKRKSRPFTSRKTVDALIFSPHPDDECIVGGLPLRLLRATKWKVTNIAVTLGSKKERRKPRLRELKKACDFLGFHLSVADFEKINLETRKKKPAQWRASVKIISKILVAQRPRVIFLPHESDGHPAHVGTHFLVLDALKILPKNFQCFVVETEFWGQMKNPNLLVESDAEDVGDLVVALACHVGEVRRNPFHARLPSWMIDNVRRGAEIVGGAGTSSPDFTFGTIYHLQKWRGRKLQKVFNGGKFLSAKKNPAALFR